MDVLTNWQTNEDVKGISSRRFRIRSSELVKFLIRQFVNLPIFIFSYLHITYFFGSGAVPLFLFRCGNLGLNGFVVSSFSAASVAAVS